MKLKSILTTALCGMLVLAPCADTFAKSKGKGHPSKASASHGKKPAKGGGPAHVASKPSGGHRPASSHVVHSRGSSKGKPQPHIVRSGPPHSTRHASPGRHDAHRHAPVVVTHRHRAPNLLHPRPYYGTLPYSTTWATPVSYGSSYGMSAADVQGALAERGFYDGPIDGVIGPMTRNAIASFQEEEGLTVTGSINTSLVQALDL